ncbi:MAG: metallophosphoesterase, partial [Nitrospira sp.]|nr:metallophosphoesterase [Nitrospira sp.]
ALPDEDGLGGLAYQATLVNQIRAKEKNVLLLNSGDLLVGTLMSSVFRGIPDVLAMNLIKYDAVVVGNHELDFGLTAFQNLNDLARFPFLSVNVVKAEVTPSSLPDRGTLSLPTLTRPWILQEFEGIRVAILGLTTVETREILDPAVAKHVIVLDPLPAARHFVREIKDQTDFIIALTHQDNEDDLTLAREVPDIDVIIGGHTEGFDGIVTVNPTAPGVSPDPLKEVKNHPKV